MPAGNSGFAEEGFLCFQESFVLNQSTIPLIKISTRTPHQRKPPNRKQFQYNWYFYNNKFYNEIKKTNC